MTPHILLERLLGAQASIKANCLGEPQSLPRRRTNRRGEAQEMAQIPGETFALHMSHPRTVLDIYSWDQRETFRRIIVVSRRLLLRFKSSSQTPTGNDICVTNGIHRSALPQTLKLK
jgi:hypothetical protein